MLKILVTNDDGIHAQGIRALVGALKDVAQVFVVAPNRQRSATGHAITMHDPLRAESVYSFGESVKAWAVSGTPADCVKLGIEGLIDDQIDMVFSGINEGANLGTDVLYSGTVSAAIEGAILGYKSVALSLVGYENMDYTESAQFAKRLAQKLNEESMENDTLLNVNIPCCKSDEIKGVAITTLGVRKYNNTFVERKDPRGKSYYWLGGEVMKNENGEQTDIYSIENNYISLTPIHFDLTRFDWIKKLEDWKIK